jgi:hypothetical protein
MVVVTGVLNVLKKVRNETSMFIVKSLLPFYDVLYFINESLLLEL